MPRGRRIVDEHLNALSDRKSEKRKSRLRVPIEPLKTRIIEFKYRGEIETLPTNYQLKVQYVPKSATTEGKCLEKGEPKSGNKTKGKSRPSKKGKAAPTPSQSHQPGLISKLPEPRFRVLKQATEYQEPTNAQAPYYRKNANIGEEKEDEANAKNMTEKRKRKGKKRKRTVKKKVVTDVVKCDEVKVEYDMDEEDAIWLDTINQKRKSNRLLSVGKNDFEKLMDRLEKESFTQSQHNGSNGPAIDEDAVCCICNDGECQNSNAILFCDMCNLAVHQECYGVPYIPEGQWLCRRCLQSPTRAVDCVLCPNKGGAFKHTDDNRWAHVICALWIPEVCFANTVFLEPIDSICAIPPARWKLVCCVCHQKNAGACIQCHKSNCYVAFHVTCAQQAGLYMKIEAVNEVTPQGINTTVRKLAFCFNHAPASKSGSSNGLYSSGDESKEGKGGEQKIKDKIKKARKMLAAKRSSSIPVVNIPTIPTETLSTLSCGLAFPGRNHFLLRLYAYWRLKRQSRAPALLLRRLQTGNSTMRFDQLLKKEKGNKAHKINKIKNYAEKLRRIRYGLEIVRMLTNQIMKRERQKFLLINNRRQYQANRLQPFKEFLLFILNKVAEKDVNQFFLEPVSIIDVPNYLKFINEPMDVGTMRQKVEHFQYSSFDAFQSDLRLITDNCKKFNSKDTIWHKAALKLEVAINELLAQHRPLARNYDPETGTHAHLPNISSSLSSPNSL